MKNSRRNFCKNSVYIGLGLSFFPSLAYTKTQETISKKVLILAKNGQNAVKINGLIRHEDLSPVQDAIIEIWHNNSEDHHEKFEYFGKIKTNDLGEYSLVTDFPEKHFEDGIRKMRRIFLKVLKADSELSTTLYFGETGKAFIDGSHVENVPKQFRTELPKTKFENGKYSDIQFNIYLNS
jgi:protocatechuate 3,4-dioxygenase beta subunit